MQMTTSKHDRNPPCRCLGIKACQSNRKWPLASPCLGIHGYCSHSTAKLQSPTGRPPAKCCMSRRLPHHVNKRLSNRLSRTPSQVLLEYLSNLSNEHKSGSQGACVFVQCARTCAFLDSVYPSRPPSTPPSFPSSHRPACPSVAGTPESRTRPLVPQVMSARR